MKKKSQRVFFPLKKWHGRIQKHQRIRESMNQHAWHKFLTEGTILVAWTQLFCYVKSNSNSCGDRTSQKMAWNDSKHQQINTPQKLVQIWWLHYGFLAEWWQQLGDSSENFSPYRVGTVTFLRIHSSKNMLQKKVNSEGIMFWPGLRSVESEIPKVSKLQTL